MTVQPQPVGRRPAGDADGHGRGRSAPGRARPPAPSPSSTARPAWAPRPCPPASPPSPRRPCPPAPTRSRRSTPAIPTSPPARRRPSTRSSRQGTATVTISASNTNPFALQSVTLTAIVSAASGLGTPTGTRHLPDQRRHHPGHGHAELRRGHARRPAVLPIGRSRSRRSTRATPTSVGATSPPLSMVVGHPTDLFVNQVYLDVLGIPANYQLDVLDRPAQRRLSPQGRRHPDPPEPAGEGRRGRAASTSRCWAARRPGRAEAGAGLGEAPRPPRSTSRSSARRSST